MLEIVKCQRCGSSSIEAIDEHYGKCSHCGSGVIFPVTQKDLKNLLNQAYLYRISHEYDLALQAYEKIINEDENMVCAYEGYLLSEYGIEYIKDSYVNKYIPTCHKLNNINVLDHKYYKKLLSLVNKNEEEVVVKMFQEISNLQFALERKMAIEESFDVFISYKSLDEHGNKSEDYLIAHNIYDYLVEKGYKVFFAEKVLENRLGVEYEPIIFKALNTSKAFILVGTKKENIESKWVRNEWSRYIERINNSDGELNSRSFIPVFKGMSPYDMPKINNQFIQGVDASKIGYVYDIVDAIDKLISPNKQKPSVLNTMDNAEMIFKFEKIRRKQLNQVKRDNWTNLTTKKENKKKKNKYFVFMATPYILMFIALLLLCYPGTWFINSFWFVLYVSLLVAIAFSTGIVIKKHVKEYPLKPIIQAVIPVLSVVVLVIACFGTMYNIPIAYDGKKAYRFTTWCDYTRDVIYTSKESYDGYHIVHSFTPAGIRNNTYEKDGMLGLKVPSNHRDKKLKYEAIKIPSDVQILEFENYNTFFNVGVGYTTSVSVIYVYNSSPNISFSNNTKNKIVVYHDASSYPTVWGAENIEYIRID